MKILQSQIYVFLLIQFDSFRGTLHLLSNLIELKMDYSVPTSLALRNFLNRSEM